MSFEKVSRTVVSACNTYIKESDTLIVSVSTGIDSMVLLESIQTVHKKVHVVHFNHHKREQSKEEAVFIREYCERHLLTYSEFNVPNFSHNFQGRARDFRQENLCKVAKQYDQGIIVTAHHFDDQVETYIQRIFSGSSILNRKMMPLYERREHGIYFRPLVSVPKAIIIQAAQESGVQYFEDESNKENTYLRNKIRNKILPLVETIFPAYRQSLANDFLEIAEMYDYFNKKYEMFLEKNIVKKRKKVEIDKNALAEEHGYFQNIVFERTLKDLGVSLKRQRYTDMQTAISRPKAIIQLKDDVVFSVYEKTVIIEKNIKSKVNNERAPFFLIDGLQKLPKYEDLCYNNGYTSCQDIFEIKEEDFPFLKVRYYCTGDKIEIGNHHKLVRRLFIDRKFPREKRAFHPIVEDIRENKIIWIPTMYKAQSKKTNEKKDTKQIYFNDGGFYA